MKHVWNMHADLNSLNSGVLGALALKETKRMAMLSGVTAPTTTIITTTTMLLLVVVVVWVLPWFRLVNVTCALFKSSDPHLNMFYMKLDQIKVSKCILSTQIWPKPNKDLTNLNWQHTRVLRFFFVPFLSDAITLDEEEIILITFHTHIKSIQITLN